MGLHASRARPAAPHVISERDVLTLCDDGDLLLLRERVELAAAARVPVDRRVAQDIAAFERGAFPTARVTRLPAWTSCALLLRVSGVLHFLEVDADGMRLVAFQERVAQRLARRDTQLQYAVRRLQHVRSDDTRSFLRQLTLELSLVLPVSWRSDAAEDDSDAVRALEASLRLHASLHAAVQRMLEFTASSHATTASPVDRAAQLAVAMVVAVYEQLRILEPVDLTAQALLTPSSFATAATPAPHAEVALQFTPPNALGVEMRLA